MTPIDRALRIGQLRDVLVSVRNAYKALGRGDLSAAVRLLAQACNSLGFAIGMWHATTVSATATLRRVVAQLEIDVEIAVERPQHAEPSELVAEIAGAIEVLRTRDGVDVSDEQILDRARNIAIRLSADFVFTKIVESVG
jgi:hypothetical protein